MTPYYQDDACTIYHGDCYDLLASVSCDAVITDPPFNVGKDYGVSDDSMSGESYRALLEDVAKASPRQAWVTPTNRLALFAELLGDDARPVIVRRGAHGPKRWGWYDQFDMVLVRGKPNRYVSNLWDDIRLKGEGYFFRENDWGHPGYTPYPLIARLVGLLMAPGETVLDPFLGTGSTLVAAKSAGCRAVGIELNEAYCEIAAKRLAQEVLAL